MRREGLIILKTIVITKKCHKVKLQKAIFMDSICYSSLGNRMLLHVHNFGGISNFAIIGHHKISDHCDDNPLSYDYGNVQCKTKQIRQHAELQLKSTMGDTKPKRPSEETDEASMSSKKPRKNEETKDCLQNQNITEENDKSLAHTVKDKKQNDKEFEFFYGKTSPFSQFYSAEFIVNGVKYNCAEQFMMHSKAVLFKDDAIAKQILKTTTPLQQKRLGRKFSQNKDLKKALYATYPKILAEASPRDRIWGIGLGRNNPLARNEKTWKGKNLLGYALTRVRDKMMKNDGLIDKI
ncbi:hypothetical protein KUTeg_016332 [Tegillarca granosa]|uniref:NADAR domain-containing protein n=1 Tax=Tegillarca granosa TaxID=220873 RepID=A0ABQ9EQC3_TEGGR|nr:hypothetical protein KUTeg_016332 [Tegillarca granosa]